MKNNRTKRYKGEAQVLRYDKGKKLELFTELKRRDVSAHAASTAFFFFLSLVPMLIVVCTVLPYTPLTEKNLINFVTGLTPDMIDALAKQLISEVYEKSSGVLSVALIATIWSAGKGVLALMRGLNAIHDVEEERNYFLVRIMASFYTIIMLLVIMVSLLLVVFGNRLVDVILYKIPQLQSVVSFMMNFRFILVWMVLTILFAMIYAYIPNTKLKLQDQLTGAMFTSILWSVFSWGFSIYVDFGNVASIYGSLSIIVIIMLWMYFCMYIFLVGAFLNKILTFSEKLTKIEHSDKSNEGTK